MSRHRERGPSRLSSRLGLRGAAMLVLGVGWLLISIPAQPRPNGAFLSAVPIAAETVVWVTTALIAIVTAFVPAAQRWGVAGLTLMPSVRFLSFGGAWVASLLPKPFVDLLPGEPFDGSPPAWRSAAFYALLLAFVLVIANIREVPTPERLPAHE